MGKKKESKKSTEIVAKKENKDGEEKKSKKKDKSRRPKDEPCEEKQGVNENEKKEKSTRKQTTDKKCEEKHEEVKAVDNKHKREKDAGGSSKKTKKKSEKKRSKTDKEKEARAGENGAEEESTGADGANKRLDRPEEDKLEDFLLAVEGILDEKEDKEKWKALEREQILVEKNELAKIPYEKPTSSSPVEKESNVVKEANNANGKSSELSLLDKNHECTTVESDSMEKSVEDFHFVADLLKEKEEMEIEKNEAIKEPRGNPTTSSSGEKKSNTVKAASDSHSGMKSLELPLLDTTNYECVAVESDSMEKSVEDFHFVGDLLREKEEMEKREAQGVVKNKGLDRETHRKKRIDGSNEKIEIHFPIECDFLEEKINNMDSNAKIFSGFDLSSDNDERDRIKEKQRLTDRMLQYRLRKASESLRDNFADSLKEKDETIVAKNDAHGGSEHDRVEATNPEEFPGCVVDTRVPEEMTDLVVEGQGIVLDLPSSADKRDSEKQRLTDRLIQYKAKKESESLRNLMVGLAKEKEEKEEDEAEPKPMIANEGLTNEIGGSSSTKENNVGCNNIIEEEYACSGEETANVEERRIECEEYLLAQVARDDHMQEKQRMTDRLLQYRIRKESESMRNLMAGLIKEKEETQKEEEAEPKPIISNEGLTNEDKHLGGRSSTKENNLGCNSVIEEEDACSGEEEETANSVAAVEERRRECEEYLLAQVACDDHAQEKQRVADRLLQYRARKESESMRNLMAGLIKEREEMQKGEEAEPKPITVNEILTNEDSSSTKENNLLGCNNVIKEEDACSGEEEETANSVAAVEERRRECEEYLSAQVACDDHAQEKQRVADRLLQYRARKESESMRNLMAGLIKEKEEMQKGEEAEPKPIIANENSTNEDSSSTKENNLLGCNNVIKEEDACSGEEEETANSVAAVEERRRECEEYLSAQVACDDHAQEKQRVADRLLQYRARKESESMRNLMAGLIKEKEEMQKGEEAEPKPIIANENSTNEDSSSTKENNLLGCDNVIEEEDACSGEEEETANSVAAVEERRRECEEYLLAQVACEEKQRVADRLLQYRMRKESESLRNLCRFAQAKS